MYSGCAYTSPSTRNEATRPNWLALTFCGVRIVSSRFAPLRALSYCAVATTTSVGFAAVLRGARDLAAGFCASAATEASAHAESAANTPGFMPLQTPKGLSLFPTRQGLDGRLASGS